MMARRLHQLSWVAAFAVLVVPSLADAAPPKSKAKAPAAQEEAATQEGEAEPAPEPTEPEPAPAPEPTPAPAAPTLDQATVWNGLVGRQISLELTGDVTLVGKLMGQQGGQLVLARVGDGAVVGVPYDDVKAVHVRVERKRERAPMDPRMSNYGGLFAGGGIMLGIGIPAVAAGATMMWIIPGANLFMNLHLLGGGGALIAGGSAMLAVGSVRRKLWLQSTRGYSKASVGGFGGIEQPMTPWSYTLRF